jgi:sorting nexin-25
MVSQFRQALDRQGAALVSSASRSFTAPAKLPSSSSSSSKRSANEIISVRTSARQFDAWLKGISRCSTLADAKRLRSDVTAQIRRAKTVTGVYLICSLSGEVGALDGSETERTPPPPLDGRQLEESVEGVTVAQWIDYIERLYVAKRRIDKQIIKLGGENSGLTVSMGFLQQSKCARTRSFP